MDTAVAPTGNAGVSRDWVEPYLHDLYRARPEFVYSVTKDFA